MWAQWLEKDPVRMAPAHADALRSMRRIYLDAGTSDEYYLDLGATAFGAELDKLGVEHTVELFDGKHGGIALALPGRDPRARARAHVTRTLDITGLTLPDDLGADEAGARADGGRARS